jgi:RNA polymerase sigma-70 factor (ECF subfamily)
MSALPSIDSMYEAYSGRIYGYCLRRLPSREEAEDAVQHTFMNAHRALGKGVVPRSEAAWLFKIAENVCRERRRSAWRRSQLELVQDPDGIASQAVAPQRTHDELAGLADALAELPPNQQRAILLREWQGLSYREIAEQLELTEGAVETLLFRARRSLARKLDRSRGRALGNLGSAGAWAKSLFGGAAAKVAATTAVVAGIAVATPAVRHELLAPSRSIKAAAAPSTVVQTPEPRPPAVTRAQPARVRATTTTVRKGHVRGTVPRTRPKGTPPAAQPPAAGTSPAPPTNGAPPPPPPPGNVQVPPVQVPAPPQLPVQPPIQLPPLPPLPPINVPGGVPPLPPLPLP